MSGSRSVVSAALQADAEFYRMLVLDLDRTLLTRDLEVSPVDIRAAEALRERGVVVTIATGRLYGGTRPVAAALGVEGPVATMNGSEVVDTRTHEVIVGNYVSREALEVVRASLWDAGVEAVSLFGSEMIHVGAAMAPYVDHVRMWCDEVREWEAFYQAPVWGSERRPLAVWAVAEESLLERAAERIRGQVDTSIYEVLCFPSERLGRAVFIFRDQREDKGTALRRLATMAGVLPEQCVCVGDWVNDVPMLRTEALSYAMAGTPQWLHAYADRLAETESHADGGIVAELARSVWGVDVD